MNWKTLHGIKLPTDEGLENNFREKIKLRTGPKSPHGEWD